MNNQKDGGGTSNPTATSAFSNALHNPSQILVLVVNLNGTTISTPYDSTGNNTYVDCGAGKVAYNGSVGAIELFYALNTQTASSVTVSVANSAGNNLRILAEEWTGGATSSPIDYTPQSNPNANSGTGGGQNVTVGPTSSTSGDLILGVSEFGGTPTVGTGFTANYAYAGANMEYVVTSSTSISATWNDGTNSQAYAAIVAAVKAAPAALAAPTFSPSAGNQTGSVSVTVSGPGGATLCITTNGSTPAATTPGTCSTGSSTPNPVTISAPGVTQLQALATESGQTNSSVTSGNYTLPAFYYLRTDGTAANKAAAIGTQCPSSASGAMNIATHNASTFIPGDTIVLCSAGGPFTDNVLVVPSSGSSGYPITYDGLGSAVWEGADTITSWTNTSGNTWTATIPARNTTWSQASGVVYLVLRDGLPIGPSEASCAALASDGQWYWSASTPTSICVYSTVNPNSHTMQVGNRDVGLFGDPQSYITYQNLTVQHANEGWGIENSVLSNTSVTGIVVKNYTSNANGNGAFAVSGASATYPLSNVSLSNITDNYSGTVHQGPYAGSIAIGVSNTTGISGVSISNVSITNYSVCGNTVSCGGNQAGISFSGVTGTTTVSGCTITGGKTLGIAINQTATGITISKCSISGNGLGHGSAGTIEGIYVNSASSSNTIENNLIFGNYGYGLSFVAGTGLTAYNNTIWGNSGGGISCAVAGCTLKNNMVGQNTGLEITTAASATLTSDYNDWYHSAGGNFMTYEGTAYSFPGWQTATSGDAHSISSNPLLSNPTTDFHPVGGSPLLAAGTNLGIATDYYGMPIPSSGAVTIGAIENAEWTGTLSESNAASDTLGRLAAFGRSDSEVNTASDALGRVAAFGRGDSESNTASDAVARAGVFGRTDGENNTASDALGRVAAFGRGDSESNTTSDAVARAGVFGRTDSESNTASDALARLAGFARADIESIPASDAIARLGSFARADSESNTTLDALFLKLPLEVLGRHAGSEPGRTKTGVVPGRTKTGTAPTH
jgi:hypothetical protein